MSIRIHLDHFTQEEVDQLNIQRAYDMLGIVHETEVIPKSIKRYECSDRLKRKIAAINKLKLIRSGEIPSDIKPGSMIKIDEWVFTV